ncbi:hypothetical protein [Cellulophaga baltica]|uniref:Uncharacterized protein n=1 Tax=Cellulophaga baltica TaxID=76594 RepID=A0A1G7IDR8_9FLAO|nr:hypothetical protein [Cellulophaga baltica]SDF10654.1 hypothetical protein SAMN04487992_107176 [Cellulophaga baltica]
MRENYLFYEEQKFTQWWLWLLLLLIIGYLLFDLISFSYSSDEIFTVGTIIFNTENLIPLILVCLVILLFLILKLKTTLSKDYIQVSFFPFFTKKWNWSEINTTEIVTYGFVGYGIRLSLKYGTVYNIKGNHGLAIHLKNGKKLMVGTQKPEELANVIKNK